MSDEIGINYEVSQGRKRVLLYGFTTGDSLLPIMHQRWLERLVGESQDLNVCWRILGISSRLGDRTRAGQEFNQQLSLDRAYTV